MPLNRLLLCLALIASLGCASGTVAADLEETIARVKPSIVVVGVHGTAPSPRFDLRGTGFVVGDGNLVATNAHVVPGVLDPKRVESLGVQVRGGGGAVEFRRAEVFLLDKEHDLALLRIDGAALPAMRLADSDTVRDGRAVAFTGFPIGAVLGFSPVTHRGIVSAVTAIALPMATAQQLGASAIKRLRTGSFNIFQLDATAYPGNSGGPVFDPASGEVVGIINMVLVKSAKESALSHPSGISYAIPANFLAELLRVQR